MEGVVDVYMPDFKLWTRETARRYLKRADYADVARTTIKEMHRQVGDLVLDEQGMARRGLILRHLIMPGLTAQYYVSGRVGKDGECVEIARGIHRDEYDRALALARALGLRLDARSVERRHALTVAN
jgi:putative pyruvate formate lyase activating enzyme